MIGGGESFACQGFTVWRKKVAMEEKVMGIDSIMVELRIVVEDKAWSLITPLRPKSNTKQYNSSSARSFVI